MSNLKVLRVIKFLVITPDQASEVSVLSHIEKLRGMSGIQCHKHAYMDGSRGPKLCKNLGFWTLYKLAIPQPVKCQSGVSCENLNLDFPKFCHDNSNGNRAILEWYST